MKVGFIGLGMLGADMAQRIVDAGYPLTVWDARADAIAPLVAAGARAAANPAELAAGCELLAICVVDDAGVEDVLCGPSGALDALPSGSVVVVHSTVHPETCRRLARACESRGVQLLDAPVSRLGQQAKLLTMVSGDESAYERCRPVFATFGDPVVHLGAVGNAQTLKLVNNLLLAAHVTLATEAIELLRELGLPLEKSVTALARGSGNNHAIVLHSQLTSFVPLAHAAGALLRKDVGLMDELRRRHGLPESNVFSAAQRALVILEELLRPPVSSP